MALLVHFIRNRKVFLEKAFNGLSSVSWITKLIFIWCRCLGNSIPCAHPNPQNDMAPNTDINFINKHAITFTSSSGGSVRGTLWLLSLSFPSIHFTLCVLTQLQQTAPRPLDGISSECLLHNTDLNTRLRICPHSKRIHLAHMTHNLFGSKGLSCWHRLCN